MKYKTKLHFFWSLPPTSPFCRLPWRACLAVVEGRLARQKAGRLSWSVPPPAWWLSWRARNISHVGSCLMLRGFVSCVTSVRTLCYEPPAVVTAVVMTVSALAEAIGSELNTRSAAPEVEVRSASTLGTCIERCSNSVGVAFSRRRYPQQATCKHWAGGNHKIENNAYG